MYKRSINEKNPAIFLITWVINKQLLLLFWNTNGNLVKIIKFRFL